MHAYVRSGLRSFSRPLAMWGHRDQGTVKTIPYGNETFKHTVVANDPYAPQIVYEIPLSSIPSCIFIPHGLKKAEMNKTKLY